MGGALPALGPSLGIATTAPIASEGPEQDDAHHRQDQYLPDDQYLQNCQRGKHGLILNPDLTPFNPAFPSEQSPRVQHRGLLPLGPGGFLSVRTVAVLRPRK